MPVPRGLLRLLRVRGLEEEQQRIALESAMSELRRIDAALEEWGARERRGRDWAARGEEAVERLAGIVEADLAKRSIRTLRARRAEAQTQAAHLQEAFLEKRTERRQAEKLVEEAQNRVQTALAHHAQQNLDEWHATNRRKGARRAVAEDEGIVSEKTAGNPDAGKEFPL